MSGVTDDSVHYWKARAKAAERHRALYRTEWMLAEEAAASEAGERAEAERELDELRAAVERLADTWRYKGEFGRGPWQEGHGPDPDGEVLDRCAGELNRVLGGDES